MPPFPPIRFGWARATAEPKQMPAEQKRLPITRTKKDKRNDSRQFPFSVSGIDCLSAVPGPQYKPQPKSLGQRERRGGIRNNAFFERAGNCIHPFTLLPSVSIGRDQRTQKTFFPLFT